MSELQQPFIRRRILDAAFGQLGISEKPPGSNWGPMIQEYLAAVNIKFPAPWCMAFVQWCAQRAYKEARKPFPLPVSGGVLDVWNRTPKELKFKTPEAGDIFIMDFGKGLGHAGIVASVNSTKIFTIEGNSNDDGSREGYEVCRKPGGRLIVACKGFIRLS